MAQRLADGSIFDTFRIIRLIGKGGMGEVYEAYEELLQRKVAVKIIVIDGTDNLSADKNTEMIDLFLNEGRVLAKLNHPNVVGIYRLGFAQGVHYIAMEFIEGVPLGKMIYKTSSNKELALGIFEQILNGTRALHEKKIIHRDLKPRNILITKDNNVKIVDFGIAEANRDNKAKESDKRVIGSAHYIPPEVIRGNPPTFQSDIWGLGIILYEMLTGYKPLAGNSREEILHKTYEEDVRFSFVDEIMVPSYLRKIILKMCQRDPKDRYETVQDVMNDLGMQFITNTSSSPIEIRPQREKKSSIDSKTIFASLVVVFAVAYFWWVKFEKPPTTREIASVVAVVPAPVEVYLKRLQRMVSMA